MFSRVLVFDWFLTGRVGISRCIFQVIQALYAIQQSLK